ncbi:MAG: hypothetical protein Q7U33_03970 [Methylotenera sp.]|uniref:hypothetical protein n=1 Tax=Methylotenera sp. TaxID=2051956 RepID=UPI00271DC566|nr:hypothetical protein [Methylotenera sp.]MDO9150515.1 hypothetical protein [Methylotenera sp.]
MKRIIIAGTKPSARFIDGDAAYFANGAIGFYADALPVYNCVNVVASTRVLSKSFFQSLDDVYRKKWDSVAKSKPDKLILIGESNESNLSFEVSQNLREQGFQAQIEIIRPEQIVGLITSLAYLRYPILTKKFFAQSVHIQFKDFLNFLIYNFLDTHTEVKGKYRPSTGIISLLVAIVEYGNSAEYIIVGIGLNNRNLQQIKHEVISMKKLPKNTDLTPHVEADLAILRSLNKHYRISTTEPELAGVLNLI